MDEHEIEMALASQDDLVSGQIEAIRQRQQAQAANRLVIDGAICCTDCEEPIPQARLDSLPGAVRCVECQSDADRGG